MLIQAREALIAVTCFSTKVLKVSVKPIATIGLTGHTQPAG
jgi:hypothetical protein